MEHKAFYPNRCSYHKCGKAIPLGQWAFHFPTDQQHVLYCSEPCIVSAAQGEMFFEVAEDRRVPRR